MRKTLSHPFVLAVAASVVVAVSASSCRADVINGSFETGDFTGWSNLGIRQIETPAFNTGPTQGSFQALIANDGLALNAPFPGSGALIATLELFLGLPFGTLNGISPSAPYGLLLGSGMKQTFTANAGDLLTFDWNFINDRNTPTGGPTDFAFVTLNSATTISPAVLAVHLANFNDNTGFYGLGSSPTVPLPYSLVTNSQGAFLVSGFRTTSYPIPATGTYTLGFGVLEVGSFGNESALLVDNVRLISAVPEPTSLTLLGLGVAGLLGYGWRRRARPT